MFIFYWIKWFFFTCPDLESEISLQSKLRWNRSCALAKFRHKFNWEWQHFEVAICRHSELWAKFVVDYTKRWFGKEIRMKHSQECMFDPVKQDGSSCLHGFGHHVGSLQPCWEVVEDCLMTGGRKWGETGQWELSPTEWQLCWVWQLRRACW